MAPKAKAKRKPYFEEGDLLIEKIGQVKLRPFSLWMLAPAQNLEDIYQEITRDKSSSGLRFIETYKLVDDIFPV